MKLSTIGFMTPQRLRSTSGKSTQYAGSTQESSGSQAQQRWTPRRRKSSMNRMLLLLGGCFWTSILTLPSASSIRLKGTRLTSDEDTVLDYYSRANCKQLNLMPDWSNPSYVPATYFEQHFLSPLNIDLIASGHSGNETGFEQVTADWGCDFKPCYGTGESGTGCESIGFYGVGAKDPAGGGCPHGPVKVYEDLTCAIKLGLKTTPGAFKEFCGGDGDAKLGLFECLSFFANVITETGSFAETEERDPRPYCWNRTPGNTECCPAADHKPCLPDSDAELSPSDYPSDNTLWLGNEQREGKCCSYHGRGFLQVSYEPNYRALSHSLFNDETILWHYPYLLDSDGVMGWTAALWFWFNKHPAQVSGSTDENAELVQTSPREEVINWQSGRGFPGTINVINGMECSGLAGPKKALNRVSYLFAIAHRMKAKPPTLSGETELDYYPLPGTAECNQSSFCKNQFHNSASSCSVFAGGVDCSNAPYIYNASTPIGFFRKAVKMTQADGESPICQQGSNSAATPQIWQKPQASFEPIEVWWKMLDISVENVCDYVRNMYPKDPDNMQSDFQEGATKYCTVMCYKDFSFNVEEHGQPCDEPQKPCQTLAEYVSHPLPARNWESGDMGGYEGGAYLGRVGPGLVMALNGAMGFGDRKDSLCYMFGGSACHWNVGMGCQKRTDSDIHNCRVFPPDIPASVVIDTMRQPDSNSEASREPLKPGEFPYDLRWALDYYNEANCPPLTGQTVMEQILPNGAASMDYIFSGHYSPTDGFANARWDTDDVTVNEQSILKGARGPIVAWNRMMCAYNLGVPSDPDIFQRTFGLQQAATSASDVPFPLSDEQKKFAQLEFIAMAANIVKETAALGQAEEQDPRCYCNYQGGSANPCCPDEWQNNPPCFTTTNSENTNISDEEMKRGTTPAAQCCSYHGRGFLQTSYEKNYGDLGAIMFYDPSKGLTEDRGRQLMLNFPQAIDAFGVTGWTATFLFWLQEHPCQYCEGRNTTTLDWNAAPYSPHDAMVEYSTPGKGLGLTFTIINGQECENAATTEAELSQLGGQMRLALFYNLAYRMQVQAPGEGTILPLPGTKECDNSAWCKGTFYEKEATPGDYRTHTGGCWVLTPQPAESGSSYWTYCKGGFVPATTKLGAVLDVYSFSLRKQGTDSCEILHDFYCGQKIISDSAKPSLSDADMYGYTQPATLPTDYNDPTFTKLAGLGPSQLCAYVINTETNTVGNCLTMCNHPSGPAGYCANQDMDTCLISNSGVHFVECANKYFPLIGGYTSCKIQIPDDFDPNNVPEPGPEPTSAPGVCELCTECKGIEAMNDQHCAKCALSTANLNEWPCNNPDTCQCTGDTIEPTPPPPICTAGCTECKGVSGHPEDDENCKKCADGNNAVDWPCDPNTQKSMCKCTSGSTQSSTSGPPVTTTKYSTTRFETTTGDGRATTTLPPPTTSPAPTQGTTKQPKTTESPTTTQQAPTQTDGHDTEDLPTCETDEL